MARSLGYGGRIDGVENIVKLGGLDKKREELINIDNLLIAACGTSHLAGKYGEYLMK